MITKRKTILLLSIPLMLFVGGAECDDQCTKCEEAIDHMAEKIESQFCNPTTMQKAWDGIREECDHFDSAVGLMAETCSTGFLQVPSCSVPSTNLKTAAIAIDLNTEYLDFDFDIIFQFSSDTFHFVSDDLLENETTGFYTRRFVFDVDIVEGETVEVIVMNVEKDEEIGRGSRVFTFARNSYWSSKRAVEVSAPNPYHTEARVLFKSW
ncbi:hypothetical protein [Rhodohalobacter sp. 614A]|uniref:hypothetical protein n=1 Tax=Rhodohalobacter sp. 614A TaxID=2908649 RepID=UPI001F448947|nr:hypothetical protein [Rhodohalobacter sp. 614A]